MSDPKDNQNVPAEAPAQIPAEIVAGFLNGEKEPKSERFEIRFSEHQIAALQYIGEQLDLTPSEVIRRSVFAPDRLGQMVTRREWELAGDYVAYRKAVYDLKAELFRVHQQIAKLGTNVNQIAKRMNGGGKDISAEEMKGFCKQFQSCRSRFLSLEQKADRLLESYETLGPFEG